MLLLTPSSTDPAFNLALEEYLLTEMREDVLMLWRNAAAVIVGYNQNALAEMDIDYIREHNITVVRRQSGGGAVFHDLGNINFTVIQPMAAGDFSNYEKFTAPIRAFLRGLGVQTALRGRNDLVVNGLKFSGNAQVARNGRMMHHGTILFEADVSRLAGALRPHPAKIEGKGIKSVRARVTNLAEHLPVRMTADEFLEQLAAYFRSQNPALADYTPTPDQLAAVRRLAEEKYSRWEWNFGRSPAYQFRRSARFACGSVEVCLQISRGVIEHAAIFGDFFGLRDRSELERRLAGVPHQPDALRRALEGVELAAYISGIDREEFFTLF